MCEENGICTVGTGYCIYGFLTGVFVMNSAEDGVDTIDGHYIFGFSANKYWQHFALEHGIGTVDTACM